MIYFQKAQAPLPKAALVNNYYFVSRLLDAGAKPNKRNKNTILTPLGWAAHNGNLEMVKLLLDKRANINGGYKSDKTSPLIEAIEWRHWDIAKLLIEKGSDIKIVDRKGKTPLNHAAIQKNYELVKILLQKGADVNHEDKEGVSILEDACIDGVLFAESQTNPEIVKLLIENGARISNESIKMVVRKGEIDIVKYLLGKGAPISTDLILCSANGINFQLFKFLLDTVGLKEKVYDSRGFLERGILDRVCHGFWTNGADRAVNIPMLKYVLEKGVDVNQLNDEGQNVFTVLVAYGKPDSITEAAARLLLNKCKKPELIANKILDYPLKRAANQGLLETCRLFIQYGADVNHHGDDGGTVLHQACWQYKNENILKLLVENGANVDAKDNNGNTPLMGCARTNRYENIKTLVDLGANLNIKNNKGLSLLDMVAEQDFRNFLINKGAKSGNTIE